MREAGDAAARGAGQAGPGMGTSTGEILDIQYIHIHSLLFLFINLMTILFCANSFSHKSDVNKTSIGASGHRLN